MVTTMILMRNFLNRLCRGPQDLQGAGLHLRKMGFVKGPAITTVDMAGA